jgi:hypothetical protein
MQYNSQPSPLLTTNMENALATFSASTVTTILLLASTLYIQGMDKYA